MLLLGGWVVGLLVGRLVGGWVGLFVGFCFFGVWLLVGWPAGWLVGWYCSLLAAATGSGCSLFVSLLLVDLVLVLSVCWLFGHSQQQCTITRRRNNFGDGK